MATTTTQLALRKPVGRDQVNVTTDISDNIQKIDDEFDPSTGHDHSGATGKGPKIAASGLAADAVETAKIVDDAVTLAKMASGTIGNLIAYDISGNPISVARPAPVWAMPGDAVSGTTAVGQVVGGGRHAAVSIGSASADGQVSINFAAPNGFGAMTTLVAVCIAAKTGNLRWGGLSAYATNGEAHTLNNATIADTTLAVTAGQILELDISGAFSALVARDHATFMLQRKGSHVDDTITTFYVLGVLMEYRSS